MTSRRILDPRVECRARLGRERVPGVSRQHEKGAAGSQHPPVFLGAVHVRAEAYSLEVDVIFCFLLWISIPIPGSDLGFFSGLVLVYSRT